MLGPIGSDIRIEVNGFFIHFGSCFSHFHDVLASQLELSRSLGHVIKTSSSDVETS